MFRTFRVRPRNRAATIADSDGHCLPQWLSSGSSGVFQHSGRSASPFGKATQPLNRFDGQVNIQCWKKSRQRTTAPACDADHAPGVAQTHKGNRWLAQRPTRSASTDRSHPPSRRVCPRSPGQCRIQAQSAVGLIPIIHTASPPEAFRAGALLGNRPPPLTPNMIGCSCLHATRHGLGTASPSRPSGPLLCWSAFLRCSTPSRRDVEDAGRRQELWHCAAATQSEDSDGAGSRNQCHGTH